MRLLSNEFSSNRSEKVKGGWIRKSCWHVPVYCVVKWLIIRFLLSCLRPTSVNQFWSPFLRFGGTHIRRVSSTHVSKCLQNTRGDRGQTSLMCCRSIQKGGIMNLPYWKFGRVAIKTWPYHVSGFISHGFRTSGTASDWQMAILGAVDHQIEDRMVKNGLSLLNALEVRRLLHARFLSRAEIITLLFFVYFTVLRAPFFRDPVRGGTWSKKRLPSYFAQRYPMMN